MICAEGYFERAECIWIVPPAICDDDDRIKWNVNCIIISVQKVCVNGYKSDVNRNCVLYFQNLSISKSFLFYNL